MILDFNQKVNLNYLKFQMKGKPELPYISNENVYVNYLRFQMKR